MQSTGVRCSCCYVLPQKKKKKLNIEHVKLFSHSSRDVHIYYKMFAVVVGVLVLIWATNVQTFVHTCINSIDRYVDRYMYLIYTDVNILLTNMNIRMLEVQHELVWHLVKKTATLKI